MEDRYALVGISADGKGKVLTINLTDDEVRRIKRALERMTGYAKIEIVPMDLLPGTPGDPQS